MATSAEFTPIASHEPATSGPGNQRHLHVLTITPFYPSVGNESDGCFVSEPIAEMIRAGISVTVFAVEPFYRRRAHKTPEVRNADWYRYLSFPSGGGLASSGIGLYWRLRGALRNMHREHRVDLIHAHGALPCGHAAWLLSRHFNIPYLVTVHGLDAFSLKQVGGLTGEWCERISRRVFSGARRVIGVSQRVCGEVERAEQSSQRSKRESAATTPALATVYNAVDAEMFRPGQETRNPVLLSVGNLIPSKGHELILRALPELVDEFPELVWEVVGDGPELNRLRRLACEAGVLDRIRFLGRRSRAAVAEACRRCTLFVLPSQFEALGCVYLEAMATGKVAVACRGQGIEEVIRHAENGWLIAPERSELAQSIRVLLRDSERRTAIGSAARETILGGFTLRHQVQRLISVYEECLG